MATMKVVRIASFGAPDVMKIERLPVAEPGQHELQLRVHAASVNPVDYKIREGKYPAVKSDKLPYVLGRDVSGTVEACGPGMTDWRPGDEVYAILGIDRGSYAEHVIVKAQEAARKPTSLDHTAAAAVPLAGLTAWQGLFRYGGLQKGQRVLIHGGSGGVGHFAVQFAKARGGPGHYNRVGEARRIRSRFGCRSGPRLQEAALRGRGARRRHGLRPDRGRDPGSFVAGAAQGRNIGLDTGRDIARESA